MISLLAQHVAGGGVRSWGIGEIAIAIVIIVALVAIVLAYLRWAGIAVPPIVWTIAWICLGAFVAVLAIRFVLSL